MSKEFVVKSCAALVGLGTVMLKLSLKIMEATLNNYFFFFDLMNFISFCINKPFYVK